MLGETKDVAAEEAEIADAPMQILRSRDDEGVGRRVNLRAQLLAGEWSEARES
jgi:hypothetical protein